MSRLGRRVDALMNRAPVPMAPRTSGRSGVFNPLGGGRGASTEQKMKRGMEQYGEVGTLFGIVDRISQTCGLVDWHLYRKNTDGRRVYREVETRREVQRHAALDLLAAPNPLMDTVEFVETIIQHFDTAGEFIIVSSYGSIRSAGPLEIWPVRPDRMRVVTAPDDASLTGYIYVSPDGETVPLTLDQVTHVRRPNPLDVYRGLGPVQAVGIKLDSNRLASEYNRNFFLNSAEPGGIIEIEDRLDDDEFRELVQRWREQHQGVANAHRVAVLEQGKWVDRKYTMRDMMFPELAEMSREDIREAFGYPKGMTGATEDVNKAVADANERMFGRYLIRPRLKKVQTGLNAILKQFGATAEGLEFDFDDPVPEDREADSQDRITKAQAAKLLVESGFEAEDVLEVVGLPAMGWKKPEVTSTFGRPEQGDGQTKPNQQPATPSPAREVNQQ